MYNEHNFQTCRHKIIPDMLLKSVISKTSLWKVLLSMEGVSWESSKNIKQSKYLEYSTGWELGSIYFKLKIYLMIFRVHVCTWKWVWTCIHAHLKMHVYENKQTVNNYWRISKNKNCHIFVTWGAIRHLRTFLPKSNGPHRVVRCRARLIHSDC